MQKRVGKADGKLSAKTLPSLIVSEVEDKSDSEDDFQIVDSALELPQDVSSDIEALKANIVTNSVVAEEVPALPKNIDVEDELDDLLILLAKIKPQEVELPEERAENLFDILQMRNEF